MNSQDFNFRKTAFQKFLDNAKPVFLILTI